MHESPRRKWTPGVLEFPGLRADPGTQGPFGPSLESGPAWQGYLAFLQLRRAEALVLVSQCRILWRIRQEQLFHKRGYRNLGDFAQEVLKIAPRTARRRLTLAKVLQVHPLVEQSFVEGQLSICQAEVLAPVLNPDNAPYWLHTAHHLSLRELRQRVQTSTQSSEEKKVTGCDAKRLRIRAPLEAVTAFQSAVETARKVLGWDAPASVCFEAMLAEAESSFLGFPSLPREGTRTPMPLPQTSGRVGDGTTRELGRLRGVLKVIDRELHDIRRLVDDTQERDLVTRFRLLEQVGRPLALITGHLLAQLRRSFEPTHFGQKTWDDVATHVLHMSGRNLRERVRETRMLAREGLEAAFVQSSVSISHLRLLSRLELGGRALDHWLNRAERVTYRQLAREVNLSEQHIHLRSWEDLRDWPPMRTSLPPTTDPATNPQLLEDLEKDAHQRLLNTFPTGVGRLTLATMGPMGVISLYLSEEVEAQWHRIRRKVEMHQRGPVPSWVCLVQIARAATAEWERVEPERRTLARKVLERDRYHCTVPGCSGRGRLEVHHILFRSQGGSDNEQNLTTLCAFHHRFGVHGGHVQLQGAARSGLLWGLGGERFHGNLRAPTSRN